MDKDPSLTEMFRFEDGCLLEFKTEDSGSWRVHAESEVWRLPAEDLVLMGEYTTEDGAFLADDHFFIFIDRQGEVTVFSEWDIGRGAWLTDLGTYLGEDLESELFGTSGLDSRVLWPPQLRGKPLYDFIYAIGETLWQRIWWWFLGRCRIVLTEEVQEYLGTPTKAP